MVCHEAHGVEGNIALSADIDRLFVPHAHPPAHLAVPGCPNPMLVELCLSDPVDNSVMHVSR